MVIIYMHFANIVLSHVLYGGGTVRVRWCMIGISADASFGPSETVS